MPEDGPVYLKRCSRCNGELAHQRRPLTLKHLLAIVALLAFGWGCVHSLPLMGGSPHPTHIVVLIWGAGSLPMFAGLVGSRTFGRILRCSVCWAPHVPLRGPTDNFWITYLISFGLYVFAIYWAFERAN